MRDFLIHSALRGAAKHGQPDYGEPMQTQMYTEDTATDFTNPERGWYTRLYHTRPPNTSTFDSLPEFISLKTGLGVGNRAWNLEDFKDSDTIPELWLNAMEAEMQGYNVKATHFFSYAHDPGPTGPYDVGKSRMLAHIDQLAAVIASNPEKVACVYASMIGPYGEWGLGDGASVNDGDYTIWETVTQRWLDLLPKEIMVLARHPGKISYTFTPADPAKRFQGADMERIGVWNDCLMANMYDGGTWDQATAPGSPLTTAAAKLWMQRVTRITPYGGETCNNGVGVKNGFNDSNLVDGYMSLYGADFLHANYWVDLLEDWDDDGVLAPLSKRLGYRHVLKQVQLPLWYTPGGPGLARIQINNVGYGKTYNKRPIDLILKPASGPEFTIRLTSDARRDLPLAGETEWLEYPFDFPEGLSGAYDCWLALPDPAPSLEEDSAFSIRLANTGSLWDSGTGWNKLNMTLEAKP